MSNSKSKFSCNEDPPPCPICKAGGRAYMPFCSKRCADIDLGKWFTNSYAIPGAPQDDEDGHCRGAPFRRR